MKSQKLFLLIITITVVVIFMANFALAAQPSSSSSSSSDVVSITHIGQWHHPVKDVLQKHGIVVMKIELLKQKTYPVFYVRFPKPFNQTNILFYWGVIRRVAEANGLWDYRMVDGKQKLTVDAICRHQAIVAENVMVNGRPLGLKKLLDAEEERLFAGAVDCANQKVPEIKVFKKQIEDYAKANKVKAKLIFRLDGLPDPTSDDRIKRDYIDLYVGADMETHTSRWNSLWVRSDFNEILVEDPTSPGLTYLSMAEWRRNMKENE